MRFKTILLTLLAFLPCLVFADTGPKPSLDLIITENGKQITTPALVCYDAFFLGSIYREIPTTDPDIEAFISPKNNDNPQGGCQICLEGSCKTWFYGFPDSIVIQYPIDVASENVASKNSATKTYRIKSFEAPAGLQRYATADLRPDTMIQVSFQKTTETPAYYLSFVFAFIFTFITELLVALVFKMLFFKKVKGLLKTVLLMNMITIPIVWFFFPFVFPNQLYGILVAEIFAVVTEAFIVHKRHPNELTILKASIFSFFLNLISFSAGITFVVLTSLIVGM